MAELEIHTEHEGEKDPVVKKVGTLAAVLAVFLAIVTISSHRAHTAAILSKTNANDQWNLYQANRLKAHNLDAILTPGGAGAGLAARSGYPIIVVPFGLIPNAPNPAFPTTFQAKSAPFGVGFTGTACSEPRLLTLAFAFEQATKRRVPPVATP